jgi:hypothetical protein
MKIALKADLLREAGEAGAVVVVIAVVTGQTIATGRTRVASGTITEESDKTLEATATGIETTTTAVAAEADGAATIAVVEEVIGTAQIVTATTTARPPPLHLQLLLFPHSVPSWFLLLAHCRWRRSANPRWRSRASSAEEKHTMNRPTR